MNTHNFTIYPAQLSILMVPYRALVELLVMKILYVIALDEFNSCTAEIMITLLQWIWMM